jgi:hypothetical protein
VKSLITDFDDLTNEEIRSRRDKIIESISQINKIYPGTDEKSFNKAQKNLQNYIFSDGESAQIMHIQDS